MCIRKVQLQGYLVKEKMLEQSSGFIVLIYSPFVLFCWVFQESSTGWYRRRCPFTVLSVALATGYAALGIKAYCHAWALVMTEFHSDLSPQFDIPGKISYTAALPGDPLCAAPCAVIAGLWFWVEAWYWSSKLFSVWWGCDRHPASGRDWQETCYSVDPRTYVFSFKTWVLSQTASTWSKGVT